MKIIPESDMNFGKFDEDNLFQIEKSKLYKNLGTGIKTVEFILKYDQNSIIFLKQRKVVRMQQTVYTAALLDKYEETTEVGTRLLNTKSLRNIQLKFVLVVKEAEDTWLAGPMAELQARLLQFRKIWGIKVAVINEKIAKMYQLIC